jgi:hypothetical protein
MNWHCLLVAAGYTLLVLSTTAATMGLGAGFFYLLENDHKKLAISLASFLLVTFLGII